MHLLSNTHLYMIMPQALLHNYNRTEQFYDVCSEGAVPMQSRLSDVLVNYQISRPAKLRCWNKGNSQQTMTVSNGMLGTGRYPMRLYIVSITEKQYCSSICERAFDGFGKCLY